MTDLIALAARVEKAEGADREIDKAIARLLGTGHWVDREGEADYGVFGDKEWWVASYTASLDAARSLVPEGWRWTIFHEGVVSLKPDVAFCGHPQFRENGIEKRADAATPALALTAASLRARAAMETNDG